MSQKYSSEFLAWEQHLASLAGKDGSEIPSQDQASNTDSEKRAAFQKDPCGFIIQNPEYFFGECSEFHREGLLALIEDKENESFVLQHLNRFQNLDKEVAYVLIREFPGKLDKYVFNHPKQFQGLTFGSEFATVLVENNNLVGIKLVIRNIRFFESIGEGVLRVLIRHMNHLDEQLFQHILQNGPKFGGLHTNFLLYLYEQSNSKRLADAYIDKFSDIDKDVALKMHPELVFDHPEIFSESPFQKDFALSVLRRHLLGLFEKHFHKFTGLDTDVAVEMIAKGLFPLVTMNKNVFEGLSFDKETALKLASAKVTRRIPEKNLDEFHGLDFEVARAWLRSILSEYVIKNPDRFLHGKKIHGTTAHEMLTSDVPEEAEFILKNSSYVDSEIRFDKEFLRYFSQFPSFMEAFLEDYEENIRRFPDFDTESANMVLRGISELQKKEKTENKRRGDHQPTVYNVLAYFDLEKKFDLDIESARILCGMNMGEHVERRIDLFPELDALRASLRDETKYFFDNLLYQNTLPIFTQEEYDYFFERYKEEVKQNENVDDQDDSKEMAVYVSFAVCSQIKQTLDKYKFVSTPEQIYSLLKKYSPNIENIEELIKLGYSADQIEQYDWVLNNTTAISAPENDKFPCEARATAQAAWIVRHAFYLPEGWEMRRLGKILLNRLQARIDTNIHDVTYFLKEFETPEKKDGVVFKSLETEADLLFALMNTPESLRNRLPAKKSRYEELFAHQACEMVYEVLLPLAQKGSVSIETLEREVHEVMSHYQEQPHLPKQKDKKTMIEEVRVVFMLMKDRVSFEAKETKPIPELIQELRHIGQNRTNYVNDVTDWFEKNQSTPRTLLTYAFSNRSLALANGCKDNPRAIKQWADLHALHLSFEKRAREGTLPDNLSIGDLEKYKSWCDELIRCYSGDRTMAALSRLKREFNPDFSIPPFKKDLGDGFVGEILHKNDPRGFTIGFDTGCCMTLGGESESCIHAGYSHKDFGFFALYKDGVLCAQSLLYTNPDFEHILVCDNIEANQGRDRKFIVNKYQTFFQAYCKEQNPFEKVHVGTGFTEVGLSDLDEVTAISMPDVFGEYIYTDAEVQKLLCTGGQFEKFVVRKFAEKTSDQETKILDEQRLHELEKATPVLHAEAKEFFAPLRKEELPKVLEIAFATFGKDSPRVNENVLREKIENPQGHSRLIYAREEANEIPIGYFFASETGLYSNAHQTYEEFTQPLFLITDIMLVPEYQKRGIGTSILLHILNECRSRTGTIHFDVGFNLEDEMIAKAIRANEKKLTQAGWHIKSFKNDTVGGRGHITLIQNSFTEGRKNAVSLTEDVDGFEQFDDDGWGDDFDG